MTSMKFPDSQSPGNELWDRYGSESASTKGADNIIGVQSPVVDALIGEIVKAQTRKDLITATRALDRVLTHSYYVVPHWYSPTHRVAYKSDWHFRNRQTILQQSHGYFLHGGACHHQPIKQESLSERCFIPLYL